MPARNAGTGDCSAAHPCISARLRGCVSTMHVLPWAPTCPQPALCTGAPGLRCQLAALLPSPLPCLSGTPFSASGWQVGSLSFPPPPPQVLPLEIPRRTSGNQGLPPSSCSLHCLEVRLVPSSSAALGFRCPANFWHRVTKGKPAPARRVGGANPEEPPVPRRLRPQGWISDFHREGAEGTGDLTHTLQLTNGPAFSLRATSSK